jgi:hypothetical protein
MADALRDRDEEVRGLREEVRELREAREKARGKEREWEERWKMREGDLVVSLSGYGSHLFGLWRSMGEGEYMVNVQVEKAVAVCSESRFV